MCLYQGRDRPVDMWTSPHPCGAARAEPCGQPMDRAEASAQNASTAQARPTGCPHSRASRPHTHRLNNKLFLKRIEEEYYQTSCQSLTGQNISTHLCQPCPTCRVFSMSWSFFAAGLVTTFEEPRRADRSASSRSCPADGVRPGRCRGLADGVPGGWPCGCGRSGRRRGGARR